jgi:pyruvate kinase
MEYEKILQLIDAGMNVARLNFSHGSHQQHRVTLQLLKKARLEKKVPLALMLDTKGPEIRLGMVPGGTLPVTAGMKLHLVKSAEEGKIVIHPEIVFDFLEEGTVLLFDDGYILAKVTEVSQDEVTVVIQNTGVLKNQKGVNIPNIEIPLPLLTKEDVDTIILGCQEEVDFIAASFVRSSDHIDAIKQLLKEQGRSDIPVIAKIESAQGVKNFDAILDKADAIMVARGDLGVEMPIYEVPSLQKMMIRKSYSAAKPVVTATQMLESMIHNPRPTRAEVSDVANAIYDSTSAVMLSGETAVGLYPVQTVEMMKNIIIEAEKQFPYRKFFQEESEKAISDVSMAVALSAVKMADSIQAKAIFVFTKNGVAAQRISRFRPKIPIFAFMTANEGYHQMALFWGVIPVPPHPASNIQEASQWVKHFAKTHGHVQSGDVVLVMAGDPFGKSEVINMMLVDTI